MIARPVPKELFGDGYPTKSALGERELALRFLGGAGFLLEGGGASIVIDPYLSRPPLRQALLRCESDHAVVAREVPCADAVLVGHSHFDHVLDAPALVRLYEAKVYGSRSTQRVVMSAGLDGSSVEVIDGPRVFEVGGVKVRAIPSRHAKKVLGQEPLPGEIAADFRWPSGFARFRHGGVWNWHLDYGGVRVVHIGSANHIPRFLAEAQADVLLLCVFGWQDRPRYIEEAISMVKPRFVVVCHWDWLFAPLDAPPRALPFVALSSFMSTVRRCGSTPVLLAPGEWWSPES